MCMLTGVRYDVCMVYTPNDELHVRVVFLLKLMCKFIREKTFVVLCIGVREWP